MAECSVARTAPVLVLETESGSTVMIPVRDCYVGRNPLSDMVIDESRVSWHHAVLRPEADHWTLEDNNSTNGTYTEGRRIRERASAWHRHPLRQPVRRPPRGAAGPRPAPSPRPPGPAHVASAPGAAHEQGLVHRDVKPGSILVARGTDSDHPEHVYHTGFGLTKKPLSLTGFTTVGQFVGTLDFVAPEQISGRPVDARCDVYGFACVLYECLAGRPPFCRDYDMALLQAHQYDEPPPLTDARSDLAPSVDPVFATALAKNPDARHDSCLAFVAGLRSARGGMRRRRWTSRS
nr:FHA domain-containing serine/threonine-protein kinase [Streptomyces regalis]